jgi:hypothetical protein
MKADALPSSWTAKREHPVCSLHLKMMMTEREGGRGTYMASTAAWLRMRSDLRMTEDLSEGALVNFLDTQ